MDCPICREAIAESELTTTECLHQFHKECLVAYLNSVSSFDCPMCRKMQSIESLSCFLKPEHLLKLATIQDSVVDFKYLFTKIDPLTHGLFDDIFEVVCERNSHSIMKLILEDNVISSGMDLWSFLDIACSFGKLDIVRTLIEDFKVNPVQEESQCLVSACHEGQLDVVKYLVGLDGIDPAVQNNHPIRAAAAHGYLEIVVFLSTLPGVNPHADNEIAIALASISGYLDVVQYLVSLGCDTYIALGQACMGGHMDIISYLMDLPDADPSRNDYEVVWLACRYGILETTRFLIEEKQLTPPFWAAVCAAAEAGKFDIVDYLIEMPGAPLHPYHVAQAIEKGFLEVTISVFNRLPEDMLSEWSTTQLIGTAIINGQNHIVKHFVETMELTLSDQLSLFVIACQRGNFEAVNLLSEVPGLDINNIGGLSLTAAIYQKENDVVRLLLSLDWLNLTESLADAVCATVSVGDLELFRLLLGQTNLALENEAYKIIGKPWLPTKKNRFTTKPPVSCSAVVMNKKKLSELPLVSYSKEELSFDLGKRPVTPQKKKRRTRFAQWEPVQQVETSCVARHIENLPFNAILRTHSRLLYVITLF